MCITLYYNKSYVNVVSIQESKCTVLTLLVMWDDKRVSLGYDWPSNKLQKEGHPLLNRSWPWITESTESKTEDNRGLLYFIHLLHLQGQYSARKLEDPKKWQMANEQGTWRQLRETVFLGRWKVEGRDS